MEQQGTMRAEQERFERAVRSIHRDINEEAERKAAGRGEREPGATELWYFVQYGGVVMDLTTRTWDPDQMIKFPVEPTPWEKVYTALDEHEWWRGVFTGKYRAT